MFSNDLRYVGIFVAVSVDRCALSLTELATRWFVLVSPCQRVLWTPSPALKQCLLSVLVTVCAMDDEQAPFPSFPSSPLPRRGATPAELNSTDLIQKLLVCNDMGISRLDSINAAYREKKLAIDMAADADIEAIDEEKRGAAQHESHAGAQIRVMEKNLEGMKRELAVAQQNVASLDRQQNERDEKRKRDIKLAQAERKERQQSVKLWMGPGWTKLYGQLGRTSPVSPTRHFDRCIELTVN